MGAWIETLHLLMFSHLLFVAPRVGAWIETYKEVEREYYDKSHPVWVRGLKRGLGGGLVQKRQRRTPCGCVD